MLRGWRIGRIGGVDIRIDPSWPIIALLVSFSLWAQFADRARFTGTPSGVSLLLALATALLFFVSVLAHELAHAGVSKLRGIPVLGITLFLFGGATHAQIESKGPADEFLVTAAGPASSLAIGGLFYAMRALGGDALGPDIPVMLRYLGWVNLVLGVFNLLPGFPLDGGRLLRSVVWKVTGSLAAGTKVAARAGQIVGGLIAVSGLALAAATGDITLAWPALIGWFLFRAASESLVDAERRKLMERTTARDVMSPPPPTIPADLPLGEAVNRFLEDHDGEAFPVTEDGRIIGFVSMRTADGKRVDLPVREAMGELDGILEASPDDRLDQMTERLQEARGRAVLVIDDGRLVGVIEPDDLNRFLRRSSTMPVRPD